jgi:hypothetical protein
MTLTQQFLITLTLPTGLLALVIYSWHKESGPRQQTRYWLMALLAVTVWASSILSFYGGATFLPRAAISWRVVGRHALSLSSLFLLLTTTAYLDSPLAQRRLTLGLAMTTWLASLMLDPVAWPYRLPPLMVAGQVVGHFDLWSAIWVTSWFLPLLAAWILTRGGILAAPNSAYRNRMNYWLLTLSLFIAAGAFALIQQQGQPVWQERCGLLRAACRAVTA